MALLDRFNGRKGDATVNAKHFVGVVIPLDFSADPGELVADFIHFVFVHCVLPWCSVWRFHFTTGAQSEPRKEKG